MREFVVVLRSGVRYTVRAERIVWEPPYLALVLSREPHGGDTVAMFTQHEVAAVFAREHLVSEERGEPITNSNNLGNDDSIPF